MKCFNCSAEIAEGVQICPKCGANQGFTKELIFRAKNNDQAALTELYNKTYSGVYYTIKALIKDEDAALDILQDSYIKAFKSLDQLKEPEKFNAWIKQIAHNRSIDYLRKTKPLLFTEIESTDSDMPLEFEDTNTDNLPEEVIDKDETSRLIREILNDLPDEQRAVISMFYYEQMSVKEISQELGVSENTVKSRLNYGRKKVETKVLDLEKKGTKLYGLAPIPFFLLLLRSLASSPAPIPAAKVKRIRTSVANELKKTASAAGNGTAGASVKGGFFASLKASLPLKIALGVLAVFIAAGGVAALVPDLNDTEGGSFGGGGSAGAGPGGQGSDASAASSFVASTQTPTEAPTAAPTEPPKVSDYVETAEEYVVADHTWERPRFLFDTADADTANTEIQTAFDTHKTDPLTSGLIDDNNHNFTYEVFIYENIISVVTHAVNAETVGKETCTAYNFDITDGKRLYNADVLIRFSLSEEEGKAKTTSLLNTYFNELYDDPTSDPRFKSEASDITAVRTLIEEAKLFSLRDDYLNQAQYFVKSDGLYVIAHEMSEEEPSDYSRIFKLN